MILNSCHLSREYMGKYLNLFLVVLTLVLTGCSTAPFSPTTSAKSYGAGNIQSEIGNNNSTYHLKFGLGVSDNFDAGFVMEFGAISTSALFFKYAFLNNKIGPSMGFEFGYGSTETTQFYYGGLNASLAFTEFFEVWFNGRLNQVNTAEEDIEKDSFHGNIKLTAYKLTYFQSSVGFNVWLTPNTGFAIYGTYFKGDDLETKQDTIYGGSILVNF